MCSCSIQKHAIHRHQSGVLWDFKRKRSPVGSRRLWSICDVGPLQRIVTDMVDNSIVRVTHDSATSISRIHHSTQLRKYLSIYCRSLRMMPFAHQKLSRNYSKTPKIWKTTLIYYHYLTGKHQTTFLFFRGWGWGSTYMYMQYNSKCCVSLTICLVHAIP